MDRCANYLLKNAGYLKYDTYLAKGFPIATGVIEGACRYLVKDRMEVTGARWSLAGAEAVLRLRALQASGDFDAYWHFHERQESLRNHAERYAEGKVVPVRGPKRPHLKRVKQIPAVQSLGLPCQIVLETTQPQNAFAAPIHLAFDVLKEPHPIHLK